MTALNEPVAKRIAKLFRSLSSDFDGEVLGAVAAMKRLFAAEGLSFHDIATVIESCNGEIEDRKYSDADAKAIFERGMAKGRAEQQDNNLEFFDGDGRPRWYDMAVYLPAQCRAAAQPVGKRFHRRHCRQGARNSAEPEAGKVHPQDLRQVGRLM